VLAENLEVAARVEELVVGALGVRAELLLAELDELRAQLLLPVGVEPVGIPVIAEPPERLAGPRLLGHQLLQRFVVVPAIVGRGAVWRPEYEGAADPLAVSRSERPSLRTRAGGPRRGPPGSRSTPQPAAEECSRAVRGRRTRRSCGR